MKKAAINLFGPYQMGSFILRNRFVMASIPRMRCDPQTGVPNEVMIEHYVQRAKTVGLVVTEPTYVHSRGNAYPGTPGIETKKQVEGWKKLVKAVKKEGATIFCKLYHCGRVGHSQFLNGKKPLGPSPIPIKGQLNTPSGVLEPEEPEEMTLKQINEVIAQFTLAAQACERAGFDGVELSAASGYLIDQFLRDGANKRNDEYGGNAINRSRLALQIIDELVKVFGHERVGMRISPVSRFNDMYDLNPFGTYSYLLKKASEKKIGYVMISESDAKYWKVAPAREGSKQIANCAVKFRPFFEGPLITTGSLKFEEANRRVQEGEADLIAFGTKFVANPDLVERLKNGWPVARLKPDTLYGEEGKGYIDYPNYSPAE